MFNSNVIGRNKRSLWIKELTKEKNVIINYQRTKIKEDKARSKKKKRMNGGTKGYFVSLLLIQAQIALNILLSQAEMSKLKYLHQLYLLLAMGK